MMDRFNIDCSFGYPRLLISGITLVLSILLILLSDQLLRFLFYPMMSPELSLRKDNPFVHTWNWLFADMANTGPSPKPNLVDEESSGSHIFWSNTLLTLVSLGVVSLAIYGFYFGN
ncbi:MAG: hypothetical protein KF752_09425 [Pirellulaceae bacterium]|nr:hypothetical protein [Pirellulaceae bacterium]